MRTIEFRGKDIETGEWLYGDLRQMLGYWPAIIMSYPTDEGKVGYREVAVKEKTIGQFTSLYDKNGKEIYEGDIISDNIGTLYVSVFENGCFDFRDKDGRGIANPIAAISVIVGNIYDNPELMKGEAT